jgi:hypothetical protein
MPGTVHCTLYPMHCTNVECWLHAHRTIIDYTHYTVLILAPCAHSHCPGSHVVVKVSVACVSNFECVNSR